MGELREILTFVAGQFDPIVPVVGNLYLQGIAPQELISEAPKDEGSKQQNADYERFGESARKNPRRY
ncbi:MAG: hypothetical protein ABR923_09940 [Terracidiphilus sp.]